MGALLLYVGDRVGPHDAVAAADGGLTPVELAAATSAAERMVTASLRTMTTCELTRVDQATGRHRLDARWAMLLPDGGGQRDQFVWPTSASRAQ